MINIDKNKYICYNDFIPSIYFTEKFMKKLEKTALVCTALAVAVGAGALGYVFGRVQGLGEAANGYEEVIADQSAKAKEFYKEIYEMPSIYEAAVVRVTNKWRDQAKDYYEARYYMVLGNDLVRRLDKDTRELQVRAHLGRLLEKQDKAIKVSPSIQQDLPNSSVAAQHSGLSY